MKTALLFLVLFILIIILGCSANSYNADNNDSLPLSKHLVELAQYEIPLHIYPQALDLIDMVIVDIRSYEVDIIINNNSDWNIMGDFGHKVEIFTDGNWLSINFNDYVFTHLSFTPIIPPGDTLPLTVLLPNFIPFPPPYTLPLEAGHYRIRRTVYLRNLCDEFIATHEITVEFYVIE